MADESNRPHKERPDVSGLKMIRLEYYHSAEGSSAEQQKMVRDLGFTRVGQILEKPDLLTIHHIVTDGVPHLIRIIE